MFVLATTAICSCVAQQSRITNQIPQTNSSPITTPSDNSSVENEARVIVGLDDKQKAAANADDIRVKRVKYLLEELAKLTGETTTAIAAATDSTSDFLEDKYGKNIARQKLLEEMKAFYSSPKLKIKPSYKEAITAQAMLEYAK